MNLSGTKTYIGILVALIPTVASLMGYDTSVSFDQDATKLFEDGLTLLGLILAFYGRAVAVVPGLFAKK